MKKRKVQTKISHKIVISLSLLLLISAFVTFITLPSPATQLHPLALIPVPPEQQLSYSGPLVSQELNKSVLGAETIVPRDIITYINEERMKRGIRPLRENPILTKAAQMRADVIMKHQNFSHQDPYDHIQLDTVLPLLKYPFHYASENIGMGDSSARAFVTGFMNSPSHRDNLLSPTLIETGVAVTSGPYQQYYVNIAVQIFADPWDTSSYAGYTKVDEEEYKKLLIDMGKQLALTKELKEKDPTNADFYDSWQRLLIRQQEIIATLSQADAEKPYGKELIAMIKEYNANWASVPLKTN